MIEVILADDHHLVRYGIKALLESDPQITVVGEAKSGLGVLELLAQCTGSPMVIADQHMPEMTGLELLMKVKNDYPAIRVVFLTMAHDDGTISSALENGADGYLLKDINADELIFAVRHISRGGKYISSVLSHKFLTRSLQTIQAEPLPDSEVQLSDRELEILTLISDGHTNEEISEQVFLSKRTIEGHRHAMMEKTKTRNTAALVKYGMVHRLIS